FRLTEQGTAVRASDLEDRADTLLIGAGVLGDGLGRLVEQLLIMAILDHVQKGADGQLGRVERRDAGAVEHLASCPNRLAAHPASEDWLAFRVPDRGELSRRLGWVRHRLWRQQDEQPVDVI